MPDRTTVLLASDNEDTRAIFRSRFEHAGYAVIEARNGEDAVRTAREDHPDVMIVNRTLPLIDGWDVARTLKADPATSGIRIIGMSACCLPEDVAVARAAGCDAFLGKPFEPRRMLEEVERLIGPAAGATRKVRMDESRTVVLADHSDDSRLVYRTLLEHRGYRVIEAPEGGDGSDAVRAAREHAPALMVVRRQRLRDGRWNTVWRVKGDPETSCIRIIAVSADSAVQRDAEEAGCDLFLTDPDPWRLAAEVERLIGPARDPAPGS